MKWFMADFPASPAVLNRLFCYATPAVTPAEPAASPAAGAPPASPAVAVTPGTPATPASSPNDENIRNLRTGYESYQKLGKVEELAPIIQGYRGAETSVAEIGAKLGFSAESVKAAFAQDPVGTIRRLAELEAKAGPPANAATPDPDKLLDEKLNERLTPITQHINTQRAQAATAKFDTQFDSLFSNHAEFKGAADVPKEVREVLYNMVSSGFKEDKDAMLRLLNEGKTSDVQKYFDGVMEQFLKVTNSYSQWKSARTGGPQPPPTNQPPTKKKPTLQDFIEGNAAAQEAAPSFRS